MRKQVIYCTGILAGSFLLSVSCQDTKISEPNQVRDNISPKAEPLNSLANPVLMGGVSLGQLIQGLYRTNRFSDLVSFTDCGNYGKGTVERFYRSDKFRLDYNLGKLNGMYREQDTIFLTYSNASIYGTRRKIVLKCRIVNDTVKLILPNINQEFTGR